MSAAMGFAAVLIALAAPFPATAEDAPGDATPSAEEGVYQLDQIVVTGSRTEQRLSEAPVATEVISREELKKSGAHTLGEFLTDHPGVEVVQTPGGAGIRLQGLDPDYTLILINGERLSGRVAGTIDADRIRLENVERIEIVKGATSALYGSDAIGGVVNIITREPEKGLEAELYAAYGSDNTIDLRADAGVRDGPWTLNASGGWYHIDGYDLDASDIATTGGAGDDYNATIRGGYGKNDFRLTLLLDFLRRQTESVDVTPVTTVPVYDRTERIDTYTATLTPEWKFSDDSKLKITGHYTLFRESFELDQRNDTAQDRVDETDDHLAQTTFQYSALFFERHLVVAGVEGTYERLKTDRLNATYADRYRLAPYFQDEWTILEGPLLVLVPGVRADVDSEYGHQVSPKVAVRFDPADKLTLRAAYGWGFRAPTFKELFLEFENPSVGYRVVGNPDLEPESSRSANISVEYYPTPKLWLSVGLFRNDVDNLITVQTINPNPLTFSYRNVSSAFTQGLEASARAGLPAGFTLNVGYTLLDTEDQSTGLELEGRPRHRATAGLSYRYAPWGLALDARGALTGPEPFYLDTDNDDVIDQIRKSRSLLTLEARASKDLGEHFEVFVGARNLLDAGDTEFHPIRPRTIYGGLTAGY